MVVDEPSFSKIGRTAEILLILAIGLARAVAITVRLDIEWPKGMVD